MNNDVECLEELNGLKDQNIQNKIKLRWAKMKTVLSFYDLKRRQTIKYQKIKDEISKEIIKINK